jgi:haloalkane dehalogenase
MIIDGASVDSSLRTPEARFANLPGLPYGPGYHDDLPGFAGLRMGYIDEGPTRAEHTFLCLHGEPTWSYLYRKMIPVFLDAGGRVVAPDLFGFGRSDKPVHDATYTFDFHRNALLRFIERLGLRNITLVCQDWGGILGLTLPLDMPERFARLLVMNTALPIGEAPSEGFLSWRDFARSSPDLSVGELMTRAVPGLSPDEAAAYEAPFPDARYKAGLRRFPELVPIAPGMDGIEHCRRARAWWRDEWRGPTFMAVGMRDPVLGPKVMDDLRTTIHACPPPLQLEDAGHFVQEQGESIAAAALAAFAAG